MNWVVSQGFTKDWALIELYDEKINWSTFKGNKVYIGAYIFDFISRRVFYLPSSCLRFSLITIFFPLRRR